MRRTGRHRIAILALLALTGGLAGPAWAGCCESTAATTMPAISAISAISAMPGCHEKDAPAIHPACCAGGEVASEGSCCGQIRAAVPATPLPVPTTVQVPAGKLVPAFHVPAPASPAAPPVRLPPDPPPLYAGVGLFTLHAVFLI